MEDQNLCHAIQLDSDHPFQVVYHRVDSERAANQLRERLDATPADTFVIVRVSGEHNLKHAVFDVLWLLLKQCTAVNSDTKGLVCSGFRSERRLPSSYLAPSPPEPSSAKRVQQ